MALPDPLQLRGSDVLLLYLALLGGALVAALVVRSLARPRGSASAARSWASAATPDEIAWLARGRAGLLESALAALVAAGQVEVDPQRGSVARSSAPPRAAAPAAEAVYRALPPGGGARPRALAAALGPVVAPLARRLSAAGVALAPATARWIAVASSAPFLLVAALGAARMALGREAPVLVLGALVAATLVFAAAFAAASPVATRAGDAALSDLRRRHAGLVGASARPGALGAEEIALAVALYGQGALDALAAADPRLRDLRRLLAGAAEGEGAEGSGGG